MDPSAAIDVLLLLRPAEKGINDVKAVQSFAGAHGLRVAATNSERRTIVLNGSARHMSKAFGVTLRLQQIGGVTYRSHRGALKVPKELAGIVTGVFGLDNRPVAKRPGRQSFPPPESDKPPPVNANTRPPKHFRQLYQFPTGATGKGESIAVLEFGGGFEPRRLKHALTQLGVAASKVVVREISPGANLPVNLPGKLSPDAEVYMDLEILASVAPGATLVVYFGENSSRGWIETLHAAIFDKKYRPSVISISWGQAEENWDPQTVSAIDHALKLAALAGITVCCSSGDRGVFEAGKPYTVAYPASSVFALACGGTQLDPLKAETRRESVWNQSEAGLASGGGISSLFNRPVFQRSHRVPAHAATQKPGRGIPDVAANASSATGYLIIADGTPMSLGGTSAAAPLWAGLVACLNQALRRRIGYLTPLLYTGKPDAANNGALRSIRIGDNQLDGRQGYRARKGWDACTGLGSPHGVNLLAWLRRQTADAGKSAVAEP